MVLATEASSVVVRLYDESRRVVREEPLERASGMRFAAHVPDAREGALYMFVLDGQETPDPYARALPFGVHGPARVVRRGREAGLARVPPPERWAIYELHVGTFSREGTFRGAIQHLDHVASLGVTALELMPIAAFEGRRGWGYDGVALYAPHAPYGTADDLRALVRAAHERGLAMILDVVYNHFGPSGNYLARYSPSYFTSKVKTPWGDAPSFGWAPMRRLVLDNAAYWLDELGFDALRVDATHAIHDDSEVHLLRELADVAHRRGRRVFFEDERNDPHVVTALGADAVWADDFHHQIHALLTGERDGYYAAYEPTLEALARCIQNGWTYRGEPYAPWGGRPRGRPAAQLPRSSLVTCVQNHDQVGNRALGERLSALVDVEAYCAAAVLSLFLPSTPLLFMGQEWAASTPFLYFSDHGGELGAAISRGRREEFRSFAAFADPALRERIPDPEAEATFTASCLRWDELADRARARVLEAHRTMLHLRQTDPVLADPRRTGELEARAGDGLLYVVRGVGSDARTLIVNLGRELRKAQIGGRRVLFGAAPGGVLPHGGFVLLAGS